jgi:hypothetical protein
MRNDELLIYNGTNDQRNMYDSVSCLMVNTDGKRCYGKNYESGGNKYCSHIFGGFMMDSKLILSLLEMNDIDTGS